MSKRNGHPGRPSVSVTENDDAITITDDTGGCCGCICIFITIAGAAITAYALGTSGALVIGIFLILMGIGGGAMWLLTK